MGALFSRFGCGRCAQPGSGQQRYFDGQQWGPSAPIAATATDSRYSLNYGFVVLAVLSLLGTIVPIVFWMFVAFNASAQSGEEASMGVGFIVLCCIGWLVWGLCWTGLWSAFAIGRRFGSR